MGKPNQPEPLPFEEAVRRFLIFVASRQWDVDDTRVPVRESFYYGAEIGLNKKVAVSQLKLWLYQNTEISACRAILKGIANNAYYKTEKERRQTGQLSGNTHLELRP